jgi:hypothetical protein
MTFEEARRHVMYVVDDSLNGRRLGEDIHAVVKPQSVLVGWHWEPNFMFVAINSYLGVTITNEEAEELATDYLREIHWFTDSEANNASDYIIRG